MEEIAAKVCKFCDAPSAKYTCPRCNFGYCSASCYKDARHRNCSEDFYKDWVQTYLKMEQASPEAQQKMVNILKSARKKAEEGEDELPEDVDEIVQQLEQVDLDAESAWAYLTEEEKVEFEELVKTGEVGKLVPVWKPWWENLSLVSEVTADCDAEKIGPRIVPLSKLTSRPPALCVVNSVLNVLCSYVYVARLYNGELLLQSAEDLLSTSAVLAEDAVFGTAGEAIQSLLQKVLVHREGVTSEELPALLASFRKLVEGPGLKDNVLRCLTDMKIVLERAAASADGGKELKRKLKRAVKKTEYFMSWTVENIGQLLSCRKDIEIEAVMVTENVATFVETSKGIVRKKAGEDSKPKVLIEEII